MKYTIILLSFLVTACSGDVRESLGLKRQAPDEFMVLSRPSLAVPPDFNLVSPTDQESLRQSDIPDEAKEAVFAEVAQNDDRPKSSGEASLLEKAGGKADPNIRKELDKRAISVSKERSGDEGMLKKLRSTIKKDPTVDAEKEKERLQSNIKEGKPVTEGEIPTRDQGGDSVLEKILE